jgi:hypothetical protein
MKKKREDKRKNLGKGHCRNLIKKIKKDIYKKKRVRPNPRLAAAPSP